MFLKKVAGVAIASLAMMAGSPVYAADAAVLEEGKTLFSSSAKPMACSLCHTLKDAGAAGAIGPDLDELKPTADQVKKVMIEGIGAMPSFAATLSDDERNAIAEYVASATN